MEQASFDLSAAVLAKLDKGEVSLSSVPATPKDSSDESGLTEIYTKYAQIGLCSVLTIFRVGLLLSRYKSGKLPKAFKVIPTLQNWEQVLLLTSPENWTTNATYEASRIFVSNLSPKMTQRFLEFVLLPKLRQDISTSKRVDVHLYAALKKAVYKPAALFKGLILPLCEAEDLTLKEATIIASVLAKVSIPVLHSAAALYRILTLPYSGGRSIFIRTLLDKKYALPSTVIQRLLGYFSQFLNGTEEMPVLWHQSLLVFCQRYKLELSPENRQTLLGLVQVRRHTQISPEIERELGFQPDVEMS